MMKKTVGSFRSSPWWQIIVCCIFVTYGCTVHTQDHAASDLLSAVNDAPLLQVSATSDSEKDSEAKQVGVSSSHADSEIISPSGDESGLSESGPEAESLFLNQIVTQPLHVATDGDGNFADDTVRNSSAENNVADKTTTLSVDMIINDMQKKFQQLVLQLQKQEQTAEMRKSEIETKLRNSIQRVEKIKQEKEHAQAFMDRFDPAVPLVESKKTDNDIIYWGHVLFKANSATITSESMGMIEKLATFLKENPNRRVSIEGYADNYGKKKYNMDLSKRRAVAVLNILLMKGVDIERIKRVIGHGDRQHGDNKLTRRVEFIVSK